MSTDRSCKTNKVKGFELEVNAHITAKSKREEQNKVANEAFEAGFATVANKQGAHSSQPKILLPRTIEAHCAKIANTVVPEYNSDSYSCTGTIAKRWQAAWDAACISMGYEPKAVSLDRRK